MKTLLFVCLLAAPAVAQVATPACTADSQSSFDVKDVRQLAGTYDLVMIVDTGKEWGGPVLHHGRLVLWVQDSVRAHRSMLGAPTPPGWERWIAGNFLAVPPDTDALWWRTASANRDHPGVMWLRDFLRIGDYDVMDGAGVNLHVTSLGDHGFRGRWGQDFGIAMLVDSAGHRVPDPGGHFCAFPISP